MYVEINEVDYDKTEIPPTYDAGRDHGPSVTRLWMGEIAGHLQGRSIETILDIGCGTGRFSNALSETFNAHLIGIDPSKRIASPDAG